MFERKSCFESKTKLTKLVKFILVQFVQRLNKSLTLKPKCLNDSLASNPKPNKKNQLSLVYIILVQSSLHYFILFYFSLFSLVNFSFESKMLEQKSCFESKMFERKSCFESKTKQKVQNLVYIILFQFRLVYIIFFILAQSSLHYFFYFSWFSLFFLRIQNV